MTAKRIRRAPSLTKVLVVRPGPPAPGRRNRYAIGRGADKHKPRCQPAVDPGEKAAVTVTFARQAAARDGSGRVRAGL